MGKWGLPLFRDFFALLNLLWRAAREGTHTHPSKQRLALQEQVYHVGAVSHEDLKLLRGARPHR